MVNQPPAIDAKAEVSIDERGSLEVRIQSAAVLPQSALTRARIKREACLKITTAAADA